MITPGIAWRLLAVVAAVLAIVLYVSPPARPDVCPYNIMACVH